MDNLYVIYLDGKIYDTEFNCDKPRYVYFTKERAEEVIETELRSVAKWMYFYNRKKLNISDSLGWYDIGEESKKEWFDKARLRFGIKKFGEV